MIFYGVTKVSNFINNDRINAFHYNAFHGLAERDGREYPNDTQVYASTPIRSKLLISRTGRRVPSLCMPSRHFIVDERYRVALEALPHIRSEAVEFKRLVDIDYQEGDFSWQDQWSQVSPRVLLRTLPDVSAFHECIGKYYEAQTWLHRELVNGYPAAAETEITGGTPPLVRTERLRLSPDMLREYPILTAPGATLMSEEAFDILDEALKRDYFIVRKYSLN